MIDLFCKVDVKKVGKLPFIKEAIPLYFVDNNIQKKGIAYILSEENFDKTSRFIEGTEGYKVKEKDKFFIFPGCSLPGFKIKEFLRNNKAFITTDIDKATAIIGSKKLVNKQNIGRYYDASNINSRSYLIMSTVHKTRENDALIGIETESYKSYDKYSRLIFMMSDYYNMTKSNTITGEVIQETIYFMTPHMANLMYDILIRNIPIVSEDHFLSLMPTTDILNKELYESLNSMLDSKDEEDHKLACELLANSDYSKGSFYIYLLSKNHYWKIEKSRYKNIDLFREKSGWNEVYRSTQADFIKTRILDGTINQEHVDQLMPDIQKETINRIKNYMQNVLFEIEIRLIPKIAEVIGTAEAEKFKKLIKPEPITKKDD